MVQYFHFKLEKFPILINLHTSVKFSAGAGGEKTGVCTALHMQSQHPTATAELKGKSKCNHSGFKYHRIGELRTHLSQKHNAIFEIESITLNNINGKSIIIINFSSHLCLILHRNLFLLSPFLLRSWYKFTTVHVIAKYSYLTNLEFEDWKQLLEEKECCSFVKATGGKSSGNVQYYQCNRGGRFKTKATGKRRTKFQGMT